jgi:hypothetical protein
VTPDEAAAPIDHTVALGEGGWRVWRSALLRAAGFPAHGLRRFSDDSAAAAADAYLHSGGEADRAAFDAAFDTAVDRLSEMAFDLTEEPLFREAVTWQNPTAARTMLDPLRASGRAGRRNSSRRQKETGIARYWSRYCAKNDTIGFFGPVCWVRIDDESGPQASDDPYLPIGVTARPGEALVRRRTVGLERWAMVAYADRLADDAETRVWLPAKLAAAISVAGRTLRHPTRGDVPLSRAEAATASRCDGRRAVDIARDVVADPEANVRRVEDVYLCLGQLAEKEFITWGIDLPITMDAEDVLRAAVEAIEAPQPYGRARAALDALNAARDRVAACAGDDVALRASLADLSATFTRVAGQPAERAHGRMYVGRTVCFEDTVRDLDLTISTAALDELGEPLTLLCVAARWLSARIADAYTAELRAIYTDLADERAGGEVSFAELSFLAQGSLFGAGPKPADGVVTEFTKRWSGLLGLDDESREVRLRSAAIAPAVLAAFDAPAPGWAFARYHSPDVHIIRDDDGATSFVLGELHAAWNAIDSEFFVRAHDEPASLVEYQAADIGTGRLIPLYPQSWPRLTPRTCAGLRHPDDWQLGFVAAPGADPSRLLPATTLTVAPTHDAGDLEVRAADGRRWPLIEVFADLVATHTVDAFKLLGSFPHTPRVWIDRLLVAREMWCRRASEMDFALLNDERERYLRARRWSIDLGLPDRIFVKVATEVKPIYVDLTSPTYVTVLCMAIRGGIRDGGPDTTVTISEMLPTPEQAWVPDAAGNRYSSELRLLVVDPERAAWPGRRGEH